ncbi:unnamed protein product, partial [Allacma fusca]
MFRVKVKICILTENGDTHFCEPVLASFGVLASAQYGVPSQNYGAPQSAYGAPSQQGSPQYGPPPQQNYGPPISNSYSQPPPQQSYGGPTGTSGGGYGAPAAAPVIHKHV